MKKIFLKKEEKKKVKGWLPLGKMGWPGVVLATPSACLGVAEPPHGWARHPNFSWEKGSHQGQ